MSTPLSCIFLNIKSCKPDVLLQAEHKQSCHHRFEVGGYKVFRYDRVGPRSNSTSGSFIDMLLRTSGICSAPGSCLSEMLDYESDNRAI